MNWALALVAGVYLIFVWAAAFAVIHDDPLQAYFLLSGGAVAALLVAASAGRPPRI